LESKSHKIFAGFCDFYVFSWLIATVLAIVGWALNISYNIAHTSLIGILFPIILVSIYLPSISDKIGFLTIGERLGGRLVEGKEKAWKNSYGINRWALFALFIFHLILLGNSWDRLSEGHIYGLFEIFLKMTLGLFVIYLLLRLSLGFSKAAVVLVLLWVSVFIAGALITPSYIQEQLSVSGEDTAPRLTDFFRASMIGMGFTMAALSAIISMIYHKMRVKPDWERETS
jgi:hypothetical protein